MGWAVIAGRGTAGALHADLPVPDTRLVRVCTVDAPALVLGSAQRLTADEAARAAALGLAVVGRRSGGGAVLLAPGAQVWVDVCVPRDDALWTDDVSRAGWWLGDAWVRALGAGVVHRGGLVRTPLSDRICFAGLGPGEVTVGAAKLVGVSQRRTRAGAVLQCTVPLVWDPSPLVDVFGLDAEEAAVVEACAATASAQADEVVEALVASLP
jgi:lipoate-protein ligase A